MKKRLNEKLRLYAPGPTDVDFDFINANRRILHHRSGDFKKFFSGLIKLINRVVGNKTGSSVLMSGSGTSAMEMVVNSYADREGKNIIFSGGTFGKRWDHIFQAYNIKSEYFYYGMTEQLTPEKVEEVIKGKDIKKVFLTHTETSSGWKIKLKEIVKVLDEKGIKVVADSVASIGADNFKMEDWKISVMVTATQKGLNLPPGLGIVSFSNDAKEEILNNPARGFYFDLKTYLTWNDKDSTPYTPAVSLMYVLEKRLNQILDYGLDAWFAERKVLADLLRDGLKGLGLKLNAEKSPANGVTVVFLPEGVTSEYFREEVKKKFSIFFAPGRDELNDNTFRIGHFYPFDEEDLFFCISAIGTVLEGLRPEITTEKALGIIQKKLAEIRKNL
ncbi:alanine--glyoxylate aminotransferase family protein [Candidatus Dependentiae bacterium]|nr:alanine--glyoxylate aminotransferase family protein [Candidatus Dependentiae bacterium]